MATFRFGGVATRYLFAFGLVCVTWNPTRFNYIAWAEAQWSALLRGDGGPDAEAEMLRDTLWSVAPEAAREVVQQVAGDREEEPGPVEEVGQAVVDRAPGEVLPVSPRVVQRVRTATWRVERLDGETLVRAAVAGRGGRLAHRHDHHAESVHRHAHRSLPAAPRRAGGRDAVRGGGRRSWGSR